jgi:hypothetical protein
MFGEVFDLWNQLKWEVIENLCHINGFLLTEHFSGSELAYKLWQCVPTSKSKLNYSENELPVI